MKLQLLAINQTDRTITVAVDSTIYEYWVTGDLKQLVSAVEKLIVNDADGSGLNLLKRRSYRYDKVKIKS
jgi:hypothetical protein